MRKNVSFTALTGFFFLAVLPGTAHPELLRMPLQPPLAQTAPGGLPVKKET